eukprot:TRINITY_DN59638_c0_g1_i1.p1 TRINITY_DN59638_c0_g1~~TRINITY_DN59638_c0_g1_i1.p1  ORF type:complete len:681 (+),score=180.49 TRINITY_DN59638_c0_g1_i1:158-2200(+)
MSDAAPGSQAARGTLQAATSRDSGGAARESVPASRGSAAPRERLSDPPIDLPERPGGLAWSSAPAPAGPAAAGGKKKISNDAQAAADAIDALLVRRTDPVHKPLRTSLAATLRSKTRISETLQRTHRLVSGSKANGFGYALSTAWMGNVVTDHRGRRAGRDAVFEGLDRVQAARVRGLLTHLEWAVKADPQITARDFFAAQDHVVVGSPTSEDGGGAGSGWGSPDAAADVSGLFNAQQREKDEEDSWPPQVWAREKRTEQTPAERMHELRRHFEAVHGSLAEAFKAMDVEERGHLSFGDFHTHLVRVNYCSFDADGSLLSLELYKLLDIDRDDLLTPRDIMRTFRVSGQQLAAQDAKAAAALRRKRQLLSHGIKDQRHTTRNMRAFTGEDLIRISIIRRFLTSRYGSLLDGLRAMDVENTGYIWKAEFLNFTLKGGLCVSLQESEAFFHTLDVNGQEAIDLALMEMLEEDSQLGLSWTDDADGMKGKVPVGIGSGGLFSDPGRLDGPMPPPSRPRAANASPRRAGDAEALAERLHKNTTAAWKSSHPLQGGTVALAGEDDRDSPRHEDLSKDQARASIEEAWISFNVNAEKGMSDAQQINAMANSLLNPYEQRGGGYQSPNSQRSSPPPQGEWASGWGNRGGIPDDAASVMSGSSNRSSRAAMRRARDVTTDRGYRRAVR